MITKGWVDRDRSFTELAHIHLQWQVLEIVPSNIEVLFPHSLFI